VLIHVLLELICRELKFKALSFCINIHKIYGFQTENLLALYTKDLFYSWAKCVLSVFPESNVNLLCIMHAILLTQTTELEFEKYQYGHEFKKFTLK